jgi:hypothetical protein
MMLTSFVERKSRSTLWVAGSFLAYPLVLFIINYICSYDENVTKAGPPDLAFGLSSDELYEKLSYYGPHGRQIYLYAAAFDTFVYSITYMIAFRIIGCAAYRWAGLPSQLNYLVFFAWIADEIENALLVFLIFRFTRDETWDSVATIASYFTKAKWLLCGLYVGTLLLAVLLRLVRGAAKTTERPTKVVKQKSRKAD